MSKYVVAHYHEIALKGRNRARFEEQLVRNLRAQLPAGICERIERLESRIFLTLRKEFDDPVKNALGRVFGITAFAPVEVVKPSLALIEKTAVALVRAAAPASFVVRTKRSDKQFPETSEAVNREVGAAILKALGGTVSLKYPACTVTIEILKKHALLTVETYPGPGGLPVGSSGKVIAMLSGGIDSPVAAWKVMKRGCETIFAHFHSYPHTSRASITKVRELAGLVGAYQPKAALYLVPLGEAQRQVVMHTEPKYRVLLYRRFMMRVADALAAKEGAGGIVTGESIGQVASQTLPNLHATESVAQLPVFRPLIGDDKEEIVAAAKRIGTYTISIEPHDDCCTLFIPKNPATAARIIDLEREETKLPVDKLVRETLAKTVKEYVIHRGDPDRKS